MNGGAPFNSRLRESVLETEKTIKHKKVESLRIREEKKPSRHQVHEDGPTFVKEHEIESHNPNEDGDTPDDSEQQYDMLTPMGNSEQAPFSN